MTTSSPKHNQQSTLSEEDKIIAPGKGSRLKPGLLSKNRCGELARFRPPFQSSGLWVSDSRGTSVLECTSQALAPIVARALNEFAQNEMSEGITGAVTGGIAGAIMTRSPKGITTGASLGSDVEDLFLEGSEVDRMIKHIEKSERKLGHSKKEAENIAWATANKAGKLNSKNKGNSK